MLEEYISQSEERGNITSVKYYDALISVEEKNIEKLKKEEESLLKALQSAMESGTIEKNSEAWREMCAEINDVKLSIEQANTALLEYENSIQEIEWQLFDLLQEKISRVSQEADFLITLLDNEKLYDDRGQLTDEGMSVMGLHGMNYNVYMEQANKYADELLNINKQLADDPYNQNLVKRREELLELQQEMILAAEDEKNAIKDLVSEGIELELDALKELIDSYTKALNSEKDLYSYQKNVKKQTEEIADLEKQLAAYRNDNSEETRAKLQEIRVSLEDAKENLQETEYERFISDQTALLDELFNEYETILNQRLDDINALISDMITEINSNASTISTTISEKAESVGYTLSETMTNTWNTATSNITTVLTTYGLGIQGAITTSTTTLNTSLATINTSIQGMVSKLNSSASTYVSSASTSSASKSTQANTTPTTTPTYTYIGSASSSASTSGSSSSSNSNSSNKNSGSSNKKNSGSSGSGSGSGDGSSSSSGSSSGSSNGSGKSSSDNSSSSIFYYKKDSYTKSKLHTEDSIVDRLKYNNYDSSFSARSDYYSAMGLSGTYTGSDKQNEQMVAWMKSNGYRNGKYRLSRDEFAWTQEGRKMEAIIRPSDGAILTPLAQDDSVLNAFATSNIFNFANDPSGFIRDNLNIGNVISSTPSQNVGGNTYDNDFAIQIELPNVTNYEQFKHDMQHDPKFEKMIRAMTVDKMFGGSSLQKYKH